MAPGPLGGGSEGPPRPPPRGVPGGPFGPPFSGIGTLWAAGFGVWARIREESVSDLEGIWPSGTPPKGLFWTPFWDPFLTPFGALLAQTQWAALYKVARPEKGGPKGVRSGPWGLLRGSPLRPPNMTTFWTLFGRFGRRGPKSGRNQGVIWPPGQPPEKRGPYFDPFQTPLGPLFEG